MDQERVTKAIARIRKRIAPDRLEWWSDEDLVELLGPQFDELDIDSIIENLDIDIYEEITNLNLSFPDRAPEERRTAAQKVLNRFREELKKEDI